MPGGIALELVLVAALLVLLVVGFLLGRRWRKRPPPEPKPRREGLGARVARLVGKDEPTDEDWRWLEEGLLRADAGPTAAREIVTRVRERYTPGDDPEDLLVGEIAGMFERDDEFRLPRRMSVVMVVGVNGTGKTTTIGKLAHRLGREGRKVAVANSDTFRAAAGEQLEVWAQRSGADLVATQQRGSDPGAVAFDAVEAAKARKRDVLVVDTAGRLHSKQPLMAELSKVRRVIEKAAGRKPDEVLLVLDATTGQNGIAQARAFLDAVDVTGIALTKLDGTAKGGTVLRIREELGVPVKLVGTGEAIDDLEPFDPKTFAESLVRG
ncbi:MAG TPA: signal recognition particle-docking protein FtsY [Actinomycetota bacterium]|nr:signal recognition particle-docking protein FtsY [Actinomycetota bacterium]